MHDVDDTSPVERPVFVVGSERSGTTLFRLMLRCHPEVAEVGQFEYAVEPLAGTSTWPTSEDFLKHVDAHRIFEDSGLVLDPARDYPGMVDDLLRQRLRASGGHVVVATVHKHFDQVLRIWPDACFVHVVRDPRDVARSVIAMGWAGNGWHASEEWLDAETLWDEVAAVVPPDRRIEVRYEDLIRDVDVTLRQVCDFIGIPYTTAMLDYAERSDYGLPDPSLVQQWRHKASRRQVARIEGRVRDLMVARGYVPVTTPAEGPHAMAVRALSATNRWQKFSTRVRRYGAGLTIADALARRLRMPSRQRAIQHRINDITRTTLKRVG